MLLELTNRKMSKKCKRIFTRISQKCSIKYSHLFLQLAALLNVLTTVSMEHPYCCSGLSDHHPVVFHHWWHPHATHLNTCTKKKKQHTVFQLLWADGVNRCGDSLNTISWIWWRILPKKSMYAWLNWWRILEYPSTLTNEGNTEQVHAPILKQ
jgi:hypothetical protein